jgi:hypothetical protein
MSPIESSSSDETEAGAKAAKNANVSASDISDTDFAVQVAMSQKFSASLIK